MTVQINLTVFGASIAFSGSGFILEFCVQPCQQERFSELNQEIQFLISWMFSWAQPEYIAYLSDSSWLLGSWGKHSSVRFCTGWCLTSGLQDTRWVHLPEKKKHTHITDWSNTSYMYAHQHQYGYENNNHYDFGISSALLSQKHLSFPAVAYEQGFHLKLLESKITRARAPRLVLHHLHSCLTS